MIYRVYVIFDGTPSSRDCFATASPRLLDVTSGDARSTGSDMSILYRVLPTQVYMDYPWVAFVSRLPPKNSDLFPLGLSCANTGTVIV